jgi:hypothetical protein
MDDLAVGDPNQGLAQAAATTRVRDGVCGS